MCLFATKKFFLPQKSQKTIKKTSNFYYYSFQIPNIWLISFYFIRSAFEFSKNRTSLLVLLFRCVQLFPPLIKTLTSNSVQTSDFPTTESPPTRHNKSRKIILSLSKLPRELSGFPARLCTVGQNSKKPWSRLIHRKGRWVNGDKLCIQKFVTFHKKRLTFTRF